MYEPVPNGKVDKGTPTMRLTQFGKVASRIACVLPILSGLAACATDGPVLPRTEIIDCPPGEVLICTSRQPASEGGAEDIPKYERCVCRSAM
jgi:hypothetical protein